MVVVVPRRRRRRLGLLNPADRVLLAAMVVAGAAGMFAFSHATGDGGSIVIRGADGYEETVGPGEDARFVVEGPVGETVVVVDGGVAFVESSDCPHQLCVNMGRVKAPGELIACVPNGVSIVVMGRSEDGPDAVTR